MKERRFTNKKLIALMLPLAVDQLLNSFMGTVDTLVVSNLGSAAISAVSLVDSINILVVQAFFALASGGTVVCSHYLGCEKKERATNAARQLVFITFAMSLIIAIACHLFSSQILGVIFGQVEPAVMENAKKYFFFSAMSYPFIALYDDGACILRAQENSKLPMQISFIANGIMSIGMGIGLMTVVGECLGAGEKEEAVYYIKKISIAAEVVLIITCLLMFGLTYPITYFGGMEPESAKLCTFMVTCITIVKPIVWIMAFIPPYGFRAAGDVKFTMTTSMLCMWLCRVVLAMVLARVFHMGPIAVWIGMFTDWTIRAIIYTVRFRNRKWLAHQVI